MKNFIITISVNNEIIEKIFEEKDKIYLNEVKNIEKLVEKNYSGRIYLKEESEEFYFCFLTGQENIFPAVLKCFFYGIKVDENQTPFLARFLTKYNDIITRTEVDLSIEEKKQLLDILKEKFEFNYYIKGKDIIIIFDFELPYFKIPFPEEIEGKNIKKLIPDKNELFPLRNFILDSSEILEKNIINEVRKDLNQSVANLLYLWGNGQLNLQNFKKNVDMDCYYMKFENGKYEEIATALSFNKIGNSDFTRDNSLFWITFSTQEESSSIQLRKLENFDRKVIGEILKEKSIKVLILFESDEKSIEKHFIYFTDRKEIKRHIKRKIKNKSCLHSLFFNNGKSNHWYWK